MHRQIATYRTNYRVRHLQLAYWTSPAHMTATFFYLIKATNQRRKNDGYLPLNKLLKYETSICLPLLWIFAVAGLRCLCSMSNLSTRTHEETNKTLNSSLNCKALHTFTFSELWVWRHRWSRTSRITEIPEDVPWYLNLLLKKSFIF